VRSGRIGKVQRVEVGVGGPSKPCNLPTEMAPEGLNWEMWLGPAPHRGYNEILSPRGVHSHFPKWRDYTEFSGGGMTDWGAHHFDIAQWGLGMDESGPVEIIPPAAPKAEYGVRFIYANGVEMVHVQQNGVTFFGTDGKIFVNRGKFEATPTDITREPLSKKDVQLYVSTDHRQDWLKCIRSRQKPICDVEIGCRTATVCHLGNFAYWHRGALKWDPQAEQFVGDKEANSWIQRERREPWGKV
jgi:hypothetical protein